MSEQRQIKLRKSQHHCDPHTLRTPPRGETRHNRSHPPSLHETHGKLEATHLRANQEPAQPATKPSAIHGCLRNGGRYTFSGPFSPFTGFMVAGVHIESQQSVQKGKGHTDPIPNISLCSNNPPACGPVFCGCACDTSCDSFSFIYRLLHGFLLCLRCSGWV